MMTRRSHTKELKEEAVRLAQQNGFAQTARDLGVDRGLIRKWKNKLDVDGEQAFPGKGHPRDEELAGLRRELARLKEEHAILKNCRIALALPVCVETVSAVPCV